MRASISTATSIHDSDAQLGRQIIPSQSNIIQLGLSAHHSVTIFPDGKPEPLSIATDACRWSIPDERGSVAQFLEAIGAIGRGCWVNMPLRTSPRNKHNCVTFGVHQAQPAALTGLTVDRRWEEHSGHAQPSTVRGHTLSLARQC